MKEKKTYRLSEYCPQAKEYWDPSLNDGISFDDAQYGIQDYVMLRCIHNPKHIYPRRLDKMFDRNGKYVGCKYCGKNAKEAFPGDNDFFTVCKEAKEMWDFEKNAGTDPTRILSKSQRKCWFRCSMGHVTERKIVSFVESPQCPQCEALSKTLAGFYPEIMNIWDTEKNTEDPYSINKSARKLIYLKCPKCGYEWNRNAVNYPKMKFCAVCGYDGQEGSIEKNKAFVTENPVITFRIANPEASELWDYCNNSFDKNPDSLTKGSNYIASFRCNKGHSFQKALYMMFDSNGNPKGCPICNEKKVIPGETDFFTMCPEAKEMWDFERNKDVDPTFEPLHSQKKAYFKCAHGHIRHTDLLNFAKSPGCLECKKSVAGKPDLVKFWDFEKNQDDPWHVYTTEKNKFRFWKCNKCGFEWKQSVFNRGVLKGVCAGCGVQKRSMATDKSLLSFAKYHPEAAKLWIKAKNPDITPDSITGTSQEIITMQCPNDSRHIFDIKIKSIPKKLPYGCPYCNKRMVLPGEDLFSISPEAKSMWDTEKNTNFPDLTRIKPWDHNKAFFICEHGHSFKRGIDKFVQNCNCPECVRLNRYVDEMVSDVPKMIRLWDYDANTKDPSQVYARSDEVVNWKCPKCGYTWSSRVSSRFFSKGECPCCETKIIVSQGINDLLTILPQIKSTYDFEANKSIDISTLSVASSTVCHWACPDCGYKWKSRVSSRICKDGNDYRLHSCPSCAGAVRFISYADEYPELLSMYDKTNEKPLKDLTGKDVKNKYKWNCDVCKNTFEANLSAMIRSRTSKYKGCSYCAGKKYIPGKSFGDLHPDLLTEYDPENEIDPYKISEHSGRIVRWICKNDASHRWESRIHSRSTGLGTCPICKDYNRAHKIVDVFPEFERYYDKEKNPRPFFTLAPHSNNKYHWICDNGHEFEYILMYFSRAGKFFCPICENILLEKGENDLLSQDPELAAEFDIEKNGITPDEVMINNTNEEIWWKCTNNGHSFQRAIIHRIKMYRDCPICTGSIIVPGVNTMDVTDPELAKEWSPENDKPASKVFKNRQFTARWTCPTCHGDYSYPIADRQVGDDSCPYCNEGKFLPGFNSLDVTDPLLAKEWSASNTRSIDSVYKDMRLSAIWTCPTCRGDYSYPIAGRQVDDDSCPYCNNKKVLKGYNSFAIRHPDLLNEWDYVSNYLIADPEEILDSYIKPVWWICKDCKKRYELTPKAKLFYEMRHMKSCKFCKGYRRKMHRFF